MEKDLKLLAEFFQDYYNIGYTHEEFIALLAKIKDGYVLSKSEYALFKEIIFNDSSDNSDGDINIDNDDNLFSGDYNDLINCPDIPSNLEDLAGYSDFITKINSEWAAIKKASDSLADRVNAVSLFVKNIEVVVKNKIEELEELVNTCTLFEGESLENVISAINDELGWLRLIRDDIEIGKTLSERNFTEEYEDILKSIIGNAEGLDGYIKNIIAESIIDPGQPNDNTTYRLDSIGEALSTKVDKMYGYGLSEHDFSGQYKEMLDSILGVDGKGTIIDHINNVVINNLGDISSRLESSIQENKNYVNSELDKISDQIADRLDAMDEKIENAEISLQDGIYFTEHEGPASISLGGLSKGTELKGRNVHDVLLEILCPFVPTKATASLILSDNSSYLSQIGTTVVIKGISVDIERGSFPIAKVIFKKRVGNTYETLGAYNYAQTTHWITDTYEVTQSIDSSYFIVEIEDTDGNRITCPTQAIDIIYPTYYGAINSGVTITASHVQSLTSTLIRPGVSTKFKFSTQGQRMTFAIPQTSGMVSEIYDQNGYLITNSFDVKELTLYFQVKEYIGNTTNTQMKTYQQKYYVYSSNPNTVSSFEVSIKF